MSQLQCPQCQAPIEQDFGVITCAHCGAVSMVDIHGGIQLSGEAEAQPQPQQEISELEKLQLEEILETPVFSESEIPAPRESSLPAVEMPQFNDQRESKNFQEDILSFANSDLYAGPLSYTLVISRIDTSELRLALREALSDPKLGLEVETLLRSVVAGRLEIKNLNPLKTSLLVQRLRRFAFEISWRQYAFSS